MIDEAILPAIYARLAAALAIPSVRYRPLTVDGTILPAKLDATIFSVVSRPEGSHQLTAGKWPLYRFSGDAAPGDTNGQGSGGVWFVVTPNGTLHKG